ncbi:MAG: hypothetical protein AB7S99_00650 [Pseudodonghicola sp.]
MAITTPCSTRKRMRVLHIKQGEQSGCDPHNILKINNFEPLRPRVPRKPVNFALEAAMDATEIHIKPLILRNFEQTPRFRARVPSYDDLMGDDFGWK